MERTFFFSIMSLLGYFKHTWFFFHRSRIIARWQNRFGNLNRTLAHTLSFNRCLRSHFTRLNDLNLLDGCVKGIDVLLLNREMVQFELHFDDSTREDIAKIMDSDRIALYEHSQRNRSVCRFDVIQTVLIFLWDRPMFGDLIACAI